MIHISHSDIQKLSEKYFGDKLTKAECEEFRRICFSEDISRTDDGGYEGCLGQLISAVVSIIGLVRADRRNTKITLPPDLLEKIDSGETMED